jgi:two-component system, response regulator YesN
MSIVIRTLIVDDQKLVRRGLISVMPWEQFEFSIVGEAGNGEKALEFISNNKVDLVITELVMPVMSGLELMKQINREFPYIRVVILTCHRDFNYIQEALRLGAIDYIVKTQLEKETMEGILERIVNRIRYERTSRTPVSTLQDIEICTGFKITKNLQMKYSEEIIECIVNAVKYITDNFNEELNLDTVAKKVNISRGYLSHCFKDIVGVSFGDFVRDMKVQKAKELLLNSSRPVYWIAEFLGFWDKKYFSRFFREYTGLLPSEYRYQYRLQELAK